MYTQRWRFAPPCGVLEYQPLRTIDSMKNWCRRWPPSVVLWPFRLRSARNCRRGFFLFRIVPRRLFFFLCSVFSFFFSLLFSCAHRSKGTNQALIATAASKYLKHSRTACNRPEQKRTHHTAECSRRPGSKRRHGKQADRSRCCRERAIAYESIFMFSSLSFLESCLGYKATNK